MAFLSMGLSAAVCVGVGLGIGLWVDSLLHTAPAFLLVGLALGEWKGVESRPVRLLWAGVLVIIAAANLVGLGMAS